MRFLLLLTVLLPAIRGYGQSGALQAVNSAMQRGDAATVAGYFDDSVLLDIFGEETIGSPAQARSRLEAFFSTHKPAGFKSSHSGSSEGKDSHYVIGELNDQKGKYRVYLYFRTTGNTYRLQELRIDQ